MADEQRNEMLHPGQAAPDFEAPTQTDETVRLSDYRGRRVALYFYPKDDTPGCTKQACSLRDQYKEIQDAGIVILGVSGDDVKSHKKFAEKYKLPFPLLADPEHRILDAYGVWGEKKKYGRTYMGIHRTTFLIDENGVIQEVITQPNTSEHADEVLSAFGATA
ncbi:MAG: thioredoxin-dependent thiol peroxidase [Rhodothermales bacterium]